MNASVESNILHALPLVVYPYEQNPRACEMNLLADFMVSFEVRIGTSLLSIPV